MKHATQHTMGMKALKETTNRNFTKSFSIIFHFDLQFYQFNFKCSTFTIQKYIQFLKNKISFIFYFATETFAKVVGSVYYTTITYNEKKDENVLKKETIKSVNIEKVQRLAVLVLLIFGLFSFLVLT